MRENKGLPHYEGWKCEWMPERTTEFPLLRASIWTGLGQAYLEVENKPANLVMSYVADGIFVGGIAVISFPSQACSGEMNAA